MKYIALFRNIDVASNKFAYSSNWAAISLQDAILNTMVSFDKIGISKDNFTKSMLYFVKKSLNE